jgi:hypothetical protein
LGRYGERVEHGLKNQYEMKKAAAIARIAFRHETSGVPEN